MYAALNKVNEQMSQLSDKSLSDILENSNVPKCQSDLIFEIFKASKFSNPKSRRYSENWMLLCLLFQIR